LLDLSVGGLIALCCAYFYLYVLSKPGMAIFQSGVFSWSKICIQKYKHCLSSVKLCWMLDAGYKGQAKGSGRKVMEFCYLITDCWMLGAKCRILVK
jgi:hypothetical protein